jgi:hypothetical protein
MLSHTEHNEEAKTYLERLCFSDEAKFHVCRSINMHKHCVEGSENPRDITVHECDSLKVNEWCSLMKTKLSVLSFTKNLQ